MEENKERDYVWTIEDRETWSGGDYSEELRAFHHKEKAKELWVKRVAAAEADWKEQFGEENYGPYGSGKEIIFIKNEDDGIYEAWMDGGYLEFHITICINKLFID